jgi:hypothetical protein
MLSARADVIVPGHGSPFVCRGPGRLSMESEC